MADRTITERLQPALLDRLTDQAPDSRTEARDTRVIDLNRLRDIIRRDLSWLLNTNNLDTQIDADRFPNAANSVLNYGVREVAGDFSTEERAQRIHKSIQTAIERFEPRIREGTVEVVERKAEEGRRTTIVFDIAAEMWAQPYPIELYLRSEVDTTTGELRLEEGS
ncbi:type VI secretion system baseplate subunit TssE [Meridianimarinicoccus roseus]|jgi:type VI secretion system protein ImpF|uniref:Type VI secretion system baseplate subunit TssE n=1 Tax=Meridianimarinicoccus roseus TaxID=2072018 RepID=A0A2V2LGZ9_9RHOB|nr:type VI secretion system baseplate subunit TssE [Meridianimarinicoccus roseus]PWR01173.1 type VI secretion system baseplate subunit TssE [Meridianimarinicoccus roseus]